MLVYYFAYGSNMLISQLNDRVGKVHTCGSDVLPNHKLCFNKISIDGTGKANIVPNSHRNVSGVTYRLTKEQLDVLDMHEIGYTRIEVLLESGKKAFTYLSNRTDDSLMIDVRYLDRIIEGALNNKIQIL